MKQIRLAVAAAGIMLAACTQDPIGPERELVGLWNLAYQETPAIYGLASAQMIFREDGTFFFYGLNPTALAPHGEFQVAGAWELSGEMLALRTGNETAIWRLTFEPDGRLRFTDPASGADFWIFRPGPD